MRITIVGAGVVGAATAYFAARRGHEVTVLDRHAEPARDASFANAGQLSYSYTDTLADPGLLPRLPSMLLGGDPGMQISLDWALLPWGLRFLRECTRQRADANTLRLLHLAADSALALEELLRDIPVDFHHRPAGKLMITGSPKTLQKLRRRAHMKRAHGIDIDVVGPQECRHIEPALTGWRSEIAGAVYARSDDAGDARAFTRHLFQRMTAANMIKLVTDTEVRGLLRHRGRVMGVDTVAGQLESDAVVLCTGVGTPALVRGTGLCVPIYPLKGYSITPTPGPQAPRVSLTDLDRRIVFANLGGRIRLAGLADCVGMDAAVDRARIDELVRLGRSVMPEAINFDSPLHAWAGLRPATPSGVPIVGRTKVRGLYLNVGHGALGWTLACGTGRMVASQLSPQS